MYGECYVNGRKMIYLECLNLMLFNLMISECWINGECKLYFLWMYGECIMSVLWMMSVNEVKWKVWVNVWWMYFECIVNVGKSKESFINSLCIFL